MNFKEASYFFVLKNTSERKGNKNIQINATGSTSNPSIHYGNQMGPSGMSGGFYFTSNIISFEFSSSPSSLTFDSPVKLYFSSNSEFTDAVEICKIPSGENQSNLGIIPSNMRSLDQVYFVFGYNLGDALNLCKGVENKSLKIKIEVSPIKISCSTLDSQIHYTLDNSEPNKQSNLYSNIFEVEEGTTIKAKAYKEGYIESDIQDITV